jgi:hypothetical protein
MNWVLIFPTFRAVSETVGAGVTYPILMNLSLLLTILCFLAGLKLIRVTNPTRFRRWAPVAAIGSIALCAALVLYFLFVDFGTMVHESVGNVLVFLTTSPVVFGFFYCLCLPALLGFFLAMFTKSLQVIMSQRRSQETPGT